MVSEATVSIYSLHLYHQKQPSRVATGVILQGEQNTISVRTETRQQYATSYATSISADQPLILSSCNECRNILSPTIRPRPLSFYLYSFV
jgi:hypothetical protein